MKVTTFSLVIPSAAEESHFLSVQLNSDKISQPPACRSERSEDRTCSSRN